MPDETAGPTLLRVEAHDFSFGPPDTITAGRTRVRLVNHGPAWHELIITRLPEGATTDAYLAAARAGEAFPLSAVDYGGPGKVAAADSSEVEITLDAGRYAISCWSDSHVKSGMVAELIVTPAPVQAGRVDSATAAVAATAATSAGRDSAAVIQLEDFKFTHAPDVFRSGPQSIHVRNSGQRPHDMTIYRLEPGRTLADFGRWLRDRQGTPPAIPVGGASTLAPGREALVQLELAPGSYFMACGTPETTPEGVRIHAQLGMIETFDVR